MPYTFSPSSGRYTDTSTGRFVAESTIRAEIDRLTDVASARLVSLTDRLTRGTLTLAEWQTEAMQTIKTSHVAAGIIAQGGTAQMTQSAYGFLGHEIRGQYGYLRELANGIADGTVPLDGRLAARAGMYGQHARATYTAAVARQQPERGYQSERNVLGAGEHCDACETESARGWVQIGSLSLPGTRSCMSNCHCRIAYSMLDAASGAA